MWTHRSVRLSSVDWLNNKIVISHSQHNNNKLSKFYQWDLIFNSSQIIEKQTKQKKNDLWKCHSFAGIRISHKHIMPAKTMDQCEQFQHFTWNSAWNVISFLKNFVGVFSFAIFWCREANAKRWNDGTMGKSADVKNRNKT